MGGFHFSDPAMVCGVNTKRRGEFERLRVGQKRETEKTEMDL